ncbi:MAG TPA: tetratricopeptide repeat protein [Phycisphaerae bacterium]|nr:tetratricopeptide repeat protein [Phycisphaerae bacterium]
MTRGRIILVVVGLFLLAGVGAGVWWYVHLNTGPRLLARVELAIRAGKLAKASQLAQAYAAKYPEDWRGYYYQADACCRQGQYAQARKLLDEAEARKPGSVLVIRKRAESYWFPAAHALSRLSQGNTGRDMEGLRRTVSQLDMANSILAGAQGGKEPEDPNVLVDLASNMRRMCVAQDHLADELERKLQLARESHMEQDANALRQERDQVTQAAAENRSQAARYLLEVVRKFPARADAVEPLIEMASQAGDRTTLDEVGRIFEALKERRKKDPRVKGPPPVAEMMLAVEDLRSHAKDDPLSFDRKLRETATALDGLLKANPTSRRLKIERARLWMQQGKPGEAESLADEVIKEEPRDLFARLLKAQAMMSQGRYADAERVLFALKTDFSRLPLAHYWYARAAESAGKTELARAAMRAVANLDAKNTEARKYLARVLRREFPMQAFDDAKEAYGADPNDPEALMLFVEAACRTDQPQLALQTLDDARGKHGGNPAMLMVIAKGCEILAREAGKLPEVVSKALARAREVLAEAAAIDPNTPQRAFGVARALVELGRGAEADRLLLAEVKRDPESPRAHFVLARRYAESGRDLQAIEHYRKAQELFPQSPLYRLALARALKNTGLLDEAVDLLQPILVADVEARRLELEIRVLKGQPPDAEDPEGFGAPKTFGLFQAAAFLGQGQVQRCIEICQAEMAKVEDEAPCRTLLGKAYLAQGRLNECVQAWAPIITAEPKSLPTYRDITSVLSRTLPPSQVAEKLQAIPGARKDMVGLAAAELYLGTGHPDRAAEQFTAVSTDPAATDSVRYVARLGLARTLSQLGKQAEALAHLDRLISEGAQKNLTRTVKTEVLLRFGQVDQAKAELSGILQDAKTARDALGLRRVAETFARMGDFEKALEACKELELLRPRDPATYLIQARAHAGAGRPEQVPDLYRKAIELQPTNLSLRVAFAKALDDLQQPLAALEVLRDIEALGESARFLALYAQGELYLRWGLKAEAAKRFVASAEEKPSPHLALLLGQRLAQAGRKDKATDVLVPIPPYAPQYVAAQLLLAEIADQAGRKLALLRNLAQEKPGNAVVVAQVMNVLIDEKRHADALTEFTNFLAAGRARNLTAAAPAYRAIAAAARTGKLAEAARIAKTLGDSNIGPSWTWLAAALKIDIAPSEAAQLLPPPKEAEALPAILGLCLAARTGDANALETWAARIDELAKAQATSARPAMMPPGPRFLCGLLAGQKQKADVALTELAAVSGIHFRAGEELAAHVRGSKDGRKEVASLLKAEIVSVLGHRELARHWAMAALKARPTCQWAAELSVRPPVETEQFEQVAGLLQPTDSYLARFLRTRALMARLEYPRAVPLLSGLRNDFPNERGLLFDLANAREQAARAASADQRILGLAEAADDYQKAWEVTKDLRAANNRAYVLSLMAPDNKAKLAEAKQLADEVLAKVQAPQFMDTAGWVAHLQGRTEDACRLLRQAVKGQPNSPEVHYHVGWAEAKAGNNALARMHMEAAIRIGQEQQADKKPLPPAEAEAARLARQALLQIAPPE